MAKPHYVQVSLETPPISVRGPTRKVIIETNHDASHVHKNNNITMPSQDYHVDAEHRIGAGLVTKGALHEACSMSIINSHSRSHALRIGNNKGCDVSIERRGAATL